MAEVDIEHLIRKRGALKSKLTNFEKYLTSLESDISSENQIDRVRIIELQQRADKFDKVYQEFEDIQDEIEITVVDSSDHLEYRAEFEDKFFAISAKAIALQENFAKAENSSPANSIVSSRSSYNVSQEQSEKLGEPVESWDTLLIHMVCDKLDSATLQAWQRIRFPNRKPTLDDFKTFLKDKAEDLETLEYKFHSASLQDNNKSKLDYRQKRSKGFVATNSEDINKSESSDLSSSALQCYFCKGDHSIYYCAQFLKLSISDRMQRVKKLKICINCLRGNHEMKVCRFGGCKICNAKHNTILHDNAEGQTKNVHLVTNSQIASDELIDPSASETSSEQSICAFSVSSNAILSTVSVIVCDKNNGLHAIRALLDCGSQSSFISTELANKLQLPKLKTNLCVSGLNNSISYVQYKCNITNLAIQNQLNTVTYGTTAGSFLAIRSLYQLANEIESEHPCIANIIRKNMYVDDLLTGATDVEQAKQLCRQIHDIFITRGFQLRKWRSNRLEAIQDFSHDSKHIEFSLNKEQEAKTLGLTWNSGIDCLSYMVTSSKCFAEKVTKRAILSKVASIFDPMGLLAPCIILAKILLQKLWVEGLSWDESLPSSLHAYWLEFSSNLDSLNALKIPRKVTCNQATYIEIHGFADASIQAYGGCVYIKSVSSSACSVELLCAKSKVAPLKTLTTPRLELCAALTLARLISKVLESTDVKFDRIVCWSDSTIVLDWLKSPPNLLKPFVDNRVAEIQKITQSFEWRHVPTHDNPADLLSRGVKPENVSKMQLWWQGPTWLQDDEANWPNVHYSNPTELPELRKTFKVTLDATFFPFDRFSNINRLKRSFAYVIRFKNNCLRARSERIKSELTNSEINHAFQTLIRFTQMLCFPNEYRQLKNKKPLDSTSKILALNPFLDEQCLLRVGGRLTNSELPFSRKHPLLLDSSHHLTKLIFVKAHKDLLHAGPQAMISHKWRLGRVLQLTPGNDNISRVATILTADGELTRAVRKICALPIESGDFQPRGHVKNQCDGGI
nr:unnamed protein product [Callosobruchus analis]